ncbi:hypothetical protein COL922a_009607 [Colletotrichum nupharicola]|nr:hypothetical protein COL922a_009607 [Colletotrichum nupharicola]
MRRLLDAVRGGKKRRSDQEIDYSELPPPPLPLLPAQRPRPITPPATATAATADTVVAALGTFALLSPELRRRVLVAAFGEHTLHLDLRPAPLGQQPSPPTAPGAAHEHGGGAAPLSWSRIVVPPAVAGETPATTASSLSEGYKTRKKTAPEWEWEWRWYGCVCHRVIPRWSPVDRLIRARGRDPYVWPHRLAQIRSLELRCEFLLFGDFTLPFIARASDKERMRLLPDLADLAVPFPNLRSLVVTFPNILDNQRHADPDARLPEIDRLLLRPLALAFAHLAPQQEKHIVVELPSNVFRDIRGIGHRKGLGLEQEQRGDEWGDGRGLWLRYAIDGSLYYYIKEGQESEIYRPVGFGKAKSGGSVDVMYAYMFYVTILNRKAVKVPERLFLPNLVPWITTLMRKFSDSSIKNTEYDYAVIEHLSASVVLIS